MTMIKPLLLLCLVATSIAAQAKKALPNIVMLLIDGESTGTSVACYNGGGWIDPAMQAHALTLGACIASAGS